MTKITRNISLALFAILFSEMIIRIIYGWVDDGNSFSKIDWFSMPLHLIQMFAKCFSLVALFSGIYKLLFRDDYLAATQLFVICARGMAIINLSAIWAGIALAGMFFIAYRKNHSIDLQNK